MRVVFGRRRVEDRHGGSTSLRALSWLSRSPHPSIPVMAQLLRVAQNKHHFNMTCHRNTRFPHAHFSQSYFLPTHSCFTGSLLLLSLAWRSNGARAM